MKFGKKPILRIVKKGAKISSDVYIKMLSDMFAEIKRREGPGSFDKKLGPNWIWQQDGAPGLSQFRQNTLKWSQVKLT